jgi:hypothetical protein
MSLVDGEEAMVARGVFCMRASRGVYGSATAL